MTYVILVKSEREGRESGRERKRKLSDKFFVYISPKLHKLSQAEGMIGGRVGLDMLKRVI